jgi:GNAT superfamily N-acetyltransferase
MKALRSSTTCFRSPTTTTTTDDDALRLAEDAWSYTPLWPNQVREQRDEFVLWHGASPVQRGSVTRIRLSDPERGIEEARAWFRERGREHFEWHTADGTQPSDLGELLLAQGAEEVEYSAAMIATSAPPPANGFEARPVRTLDEFVQMRELQFEVFEIRDEMVVLGRARYEEAWAEYTGTNGWVWFAAFSEDEVVGCAGVAFTPLGGFLLGAGTHPGWRGQGAYRALVRARWDEAARRGVPVLAVHAQPTSRPILEQLGFETVSHVHVFLDHSG